jgi:hypothetical protein
MVAIPEALPSKRAYRGRCSLQLVPKPWVKDRLFCWLSFFRCLPPTALRTLGGDAGVRLRDAGRLALALSTAPTGAGTHLYAPFLTLTALSVVPENKLRLRDDRDELAIRRCDACLPHHRSPAAMQRRRSPTIRLPMGAVLMKLVLLSIVAVRPPSVRFASVPSAPNVSAKAMTAPPCSTAGRVQSSSRTVISATILSVTALTISMPRSAANGSGSFVRCVSKSIPGLPQDVGRATHHPRTVCCGA